LGVSEKLSETENQPTTSIWRKNPAPFIFPTFFSSQATALAPTFALAVATASFGARP